MKTKKINLNWPSVLLGMALCLVLVVVMGSKAANPQITDPGPRTLQRAANVTDVWDRTVALEDRLIRMEDRLVRLDKRMDGLLENIKLVLKRVDQLSDKVQKK